jgi:Leucine-rich repeat (LRR) protein
MDDSLNQLEACQKLSLSTNAIERMIPLPKLKSLRILSLGRNNIKRIMALEDVGATLEELWISYNQIEKLDGLQPCIKLSTLFYLKNTVIYFNGQLIVFGIILNDFSVKFLAFVKQQKVFVIIPFYESTIA